MSVSDLTHMFDDTRFCVVYPTGDEIQCVFEGDFCYDRVQNFF